jgi:hypothetical protein
LRRSPGTSIRAHAAALLRTQSTGYPHHINPFPHILFLLKVPDGQIFVVDDETDLALMSLPAKITTEAAQFSKIFSVRNVPRRRVAVQDYRLIVHKNRPSIVIAPYSVSPRKRSRTAEQPTQHLKRRVHPADLINPGPAVTLNAWNKQHDEDRLAPDSFQRLSGLA